MQERTQTHKGARYQGRLARRSAAALATIALVAPAAAAAKPIRPVVINPGHGAQVQRTSGSPDGAASAGVLGAIIVLAGAGAAFRARRQRRSESGVEDAGRVTGLTPRTH
jgi:hypothetical protein